MNIVKYRGNPILKPNGNDWENLCVLNPGVVFDRKTNRFMMLYRAAGDDWNHYIRLGLAVSDDGFHFRRVSDKPAMDVNVDEPDGGCIEDPRIVEIDGVYYITYAGRPFAPGRYWVEEDLKKFRSQQEKWPDSAPHLLRNETVTFLAVTKDFVKYKRLGRLTDTRYDDRDVVLFPEKVGGKFVMLSRPKRDGESPAVWISYSDDLLEWGEPQKLFSGQEEWESERIGCGCPPVRTKDGWLVVYHGVSGKDQAYRVGFVLLDSENPSKIIARTKLFVMEAEKEYEKSGLWCNCVFPTGIVEQNGILYIYYGCADTYIAVATVELQEVLDYMRQNRV